VALHPPATPRGEHVLHHRRTPGEAQSQVNDWAVADLTGFIAHHVRLLDVDELIVKITQGETISLQGLVLERESVVVLVEGLAAAAS
jgi:hypothetical protein